MVAAKEGARLSQERSRQTKQDNSETASSNASSSEQEESWIYHKIKANSCSICRPQGHTKLQDYPSSIASKSTHNMVSQSETRYQQADVADTASKSVNQDYMYPPSNYGAKDTKVIKAGGRHKGM